MLIFFALLIKLLPLYVMVVFGFLAGRFLEVKKESVAQLLIYIIAPVVVFNGVITTTLTKAVISVPLLFFILACSMCGVFYFFGKLFWPGSEKNILAFTSGTGNTGYFGLPVVLALFGEKQLGLAVLAILGFVLYENSVGFYIAVKGHSTARQALIKVLSLPTLYAFFFGLLINLTSIHFNPAIVDAIASFRGAYVVLGMMLVGLGLSQVTKSSFDYLFTAMSFLAKFVIFPLAVTGIILLDKKFFHLYNPGIYKIMLLMAIVPLASNTVAFATKLNTHPEKVAVTVLLSTIFALFFIPLFVSIVFHLI